MVEYDSDVASFNGDDKLIARYVIKVEKKKSGKKIGYIKHTGSGLEYYEEIKSKKKATPLSWGKAKDLVKQYKDENKKKNYSQVRVIYKLKYMPDQENYNV